MKDLIGQKFGKLTAIKYMGESQGSRRWWLCKCDCGNEKTIREDHLIKGESKSCGCLIKTNLGTRKHGLRQTRIYNIWANMKRRCTNPNTKDYSNYGGRGITFYKGWESFEPFYEWAMANGYSEDLTIDRINNNLGYFPDNCRWTTSREQARNRRTNHLLTYKGETKTITEWAELYNMNPLTLLARIAYYHWPIEKAIETPVRKKALSSKGE